MAQSKTPKDAPTPSHDPVSVEALFFHLRGHSTGEPETLNPKQEKLNPKP